MDKAIIQLLLAKRPATLDKKKLPLLLDLAQVNLVSRLALWQ